MLSNFHLEVTRLAGYFSFLISQRFSENDYHMSCPAPPKNRIWKCIHGTPERVSLIRHFPSFISDPVLVKFSTPGSDVHSRSLNKQSVFRSELSSGETRPPSSPRWSPATTHIHLSHIFTKFSRYPRRFRSNGRSS